MTADLRHKILGLNKLRIVTEDIPGLGPVRFRAFREVERAKLEANLQNPESVKRCVIINTVCDDAGNLLFNDADFAALGEVDSAIIDRLAAAALKINNFDAKDVATMLGEPASC